MLQVENLSKTYKRGKHEVHALKNVTFTLGDRGFVFITGKSGSGKSTFLNLIGGLDNTTSGDIVCDGNRLSKFTFKDFDNYRNNYLGFVFQDFHLIEDLNVYQNIAISLSLLGVKLTKDEEEKMVDEALAGVELGPEYKFRYVRELSGGQKQRIAIARALVKNPRLILADEPTGNLDSKTSKIILELLQKLSEDRLVIIVSHNLDDAKKYANRIIELADGEVISDVERLDNYSNRPTLIDGTLTLPYCQPLSLEQLEVINTNLTKNNIKTIKQNTSGFVTTQPQEYNHSKVNINSNHISTRKALGLAGFFTRKRWLACVTTTLITTLLVFLLGLCQFFIQFETAQAIGIAMASGSENMVIAYKGYLNEDGELKTDYMVPITPYELTKFKDSEYSSDIYPIYNNTLPISTTHSDNGTIFYPYRNFNGLYIRETFGTLQCDLQYLTNTFGVNGQLEILAGSLTKFDYGIIITDYIADSLIYQVSKYKKSTYEDLVSEEILQSRVTINAIIKTDYKTKYANLIQYLEDVSYGIDRSADDEKMKDIAKNFTNDVWKTYGLGYTVNPNYLEACKNIDSTVLTNLEKTRIEFSNGGYRNIDPLYLYKAGTEFTLENNEVTMEYDFYNLYFGAKYGFYTEENYNTDFTPITFKITEYAPHDETQILKSVEVTIPYLLDDSKVDTPSQIFASTQVLEQFKSVETTAYSLLFTSNQNFDKLYTLLTDGNYSVRSNTYYSIETIGMIVGIFNDFFSLILIGLLAICILLIISNSYRNIKKRFYEIGVLKALGAKTREVGFIFCMQTVLTGIIVCLLSSLSLILFCTPINNTLIEALMEFLHNESLGNIEIIKFYPLTMLVNIGFIIIATTISYLIPLIKLHKIKPNIIMQKERQ